jgi:predicted Fe-Mo cluster-binding NifX family protein
MKLAIAKIGSTVATVFDFATELLVVEYTGTNSIKKQSVDFTEQVIPLRAAQLKELGIDTLICGVISNPLVSMIEFHGIHIINGITGDVETILHEFLSKNRQFSRYRLPGFSARGCTRRRKRQHTRGCKTRTMKRM